MTAETYFWLYITFMSSLAMCNMFTFFRIITFIFYRTLFLYRGWRGTGISGSLIWSKTLMELIFNLCGEFRWSPEGPVSRIHSPQLHVGVPGIFSDLARTVQILKREWGVESNGKLQHLSIPSKTAAWVPEFAVEGLPLSRIVALVPEFAVKDCHWTEYSDDDDFYIIPSSCGTFPY